MNKSGVRVVKLVFKLFMLLVISQTSTADNSLFDNSNKKSKGDYKFSKCINISASYRESLTHEEICKYGLSCPNNNSQQKIEMYCMASNLSECFENKSWKSANQLVGVPESTKIGLLTQGLSFKQGAKTGQTCAYYD